METRLSDEELEKHHDGLCGVTLKDGPCSCLVHWVKALQAETDEAKASLESILRLVVQSEEYNDEQCPQGIKDRVERARKILGIHDSAER